MLCTSFSDRILISLLDENEKDKERVMFLIIISDTRMLNEDEHSPSAAF